MSTPTPRTDERINGAPCTRFGILAGDSLRDALVPSEFARTLERELHESRNAERLARVQLGNERAWLDDLLCINATGAARLAHAAAQLAAEREKVQRLVEINEFVGSVQLKAEREKVRVLRLACERLRDCDWVISLPDRMDAVRDIARAALAATEDTP
jgi:hypothetical protein